MNWEKIGFLFLFFFSIFLLPSCTALPLCKNSIAPMTLKKPLAFCGHNESSCCDENDDLAIKEQYMNMSISDSSCADIIKSIICASCNPYSAELYNVPQNPRFVPVLCDSTNSNSTTDFCTEVWQKCNDMSISPNSPFQTTKLNTKYKSSSDFCSSFGNSLNEKSLCFNGESVSFPSTQTSPPSKGICLERLDNGTYINFVPHPDGSNRVFLTTQAGKIYLVNIPIQGSKQILQFDPSKPFLDISDLVHFDNEFGLMGLAFHPNFVKNGRFFVSYNCDKSQAATCSGKCSCNSEIGCDPSKLGMDSGFQPCRFQTVVAEFTVNGSTSDPAMAVKAEPIETRRILTMGLPYTIHHGGQILFRPSDGFLYLMMGDGGNKGDPWNFAQNKKSMLGKILRFDVDNPPNESGIGNFSLWGNYSVPKDNPYYTNNEFRPEVWAYGLRNPWRCSFDLARPSYFFCGDVGQDLYEEVNLITKVGNYGWRVYDGIYQYTPPWAPGVNTSADSIDPIFPVMGYLPSSVHNKLGSASVTGGYVYRSMTDPCLYGRYIYADLYAGDMWAGTETPESSGNFSNDPISFACTKRSPVPCDYTSGTDFPSLGYIFSFGQDNNRDIFFLTIKGVYRIVRPSLCGFVCSMEKPLETPAQHETQAPAISPSSNLGVELEFLLYERIGVFVFVCSFLYFWF
ncbi:hypothetical protein LUZ60_010479 [Juncus effusus]|nr:hypothetical protein LUZ60_010479 [Juncus effusus]